VIVKRGDTFKIVGYIGSAGEKADITGYAIRSQLRTRAGGLIAALDVTIDLPGRTFTLGASHQSTATWPVGAAQCDVEITDSRADVRSTQTFTLSIIEGITR